MIDNKVGKKGTDAAHYIAASAHYPHNTIDATSWSIREQVKDGNGN